MSGLALKVRQFLIQNLRGAVQKKIKFLAENMFADKGFAPSLFTDKSAKNGRFFYGSPKNIRRNKFSKNESFRRDYMIICVRGGGRSQHLGGGVAN